MCSKTESILNSLKTTLTANDNVEKFQIFCGHPIICVIYKPCDQEEFLENNLKKEDKLYIFLQDPSAFMPILNKHGYYKVYCPESVIIPAGQTMIFDSKLLFMFPSSNVGILSASPSLARQGVVSMGFAFKSEPIHKLNVVLRNHRKDSFIVKCGVCIAQFQIVKDY